MINFINKEKLKKESFQELINKQNNISFDCNALEITSKHIIPL